MYRSCVNSEFHEKVGKRSLIVSVDCRKIVLSVAHESPLAGHFSHRKTNEGPRSVLLARYES